MILKIEDSLIKSTRIDLVLKALSRLIEVYAICVAEKGGYPGTPYRSRPRIGSKDLAQSVADVQDPLSTDMTCYITKGVNKTSHHSALTFAQNLNLAILLYPMVR